nr:DUF1413 domain-containing protein [Clostridium perfringens]
MPKGNFELNKICPNWDSISKGDKIRIGKGFKNEVITGKVPNVKSIGTIKNDRHEWYEKL